MYLLKIFIFSLVALCCLLTSTLAAAKSNQTLTKKNEATNGTNTRQIATSASSINAQGSSIAATTLLPTTHLPDQGTTSKQSRNISISSINLVEVVQTTSKMSDSTLSVDPSKIITSTISVETSSTEKTTEIVDTSLEASQMPAILVTNAFISGRDKEPTSSKTVSLEKLTYGPVASTMATDVYETSSESSETDDEFPPWCIGIIIGAILLVAGIAIILFYCFCKKKKKKDKTNLKSAENGTGPKSVVSEVSDSKVKSGLDDTKDNGLPEASSSGPKLSDDKAKTILDPKKNSKSKSNEKPKTLLDPSKSKKNGKPKDLLDQKAATPRAARSRSSKAKSIFSSGRSTKSKSKAKSLKSKFGQSGKSKARSSVTEGTEGNSLMPVQMKATPLNLDKIVPIMKHSNPAIQ